MADKVSTGIVSVEIEGVRHCAEYELHKGVITLFTEDHGCAAMHFRHGDVEAAARELLVDVLRMAGERGPSV